MRVLVSGASGFLGRALCAALARAGHAPVALSRTPLPEFDASGIPWYRCDLPAGIDMRAFTPKADALVHCAYSTRFRSEPEAIATNVEGSRALLAAFRQSGGGQFVFVSSFAAHEKAESIYGRTKLMIEAALDPARDTILRAGLIIGAGGIFARISQSIRSLGVVPLFYGGRQELQVIWIDDLCAAIVAAVERRLAGRYFVAGPRAVPIREFYSGIARLQKQRPRFIPLPGPATLWLLRVAERAGVPFPLTSENLLGLKAARTFEVEADLATLGIRPIPWEIALQRLDNSDPLMFNC
jgi:nucleoside-diphosphate-sugar epimerase